MSQNPSTTSSIKDLDMPWTRFRMDSLNNIYSKVIMILGHLSSPVSPKQSKMCQNGPKSPKYRVFYQFIFGTLAHLTPCFGPPGDTKYHGVFGGCSSPLNFSPPPLIPGTPLSNVGKRHSNVIMMMINWLK